MKDSLQSACVSVHYGEAVPLRLPWCPDCSVCLLAVSVSTPSSSFISRAPLGTLTVRRKETCAGSLGLLFSRVPPNGDKQHEEHAGWLHRRHHTPSQSGAAILPAPHDEGRLAIEMVGSSNEDPLEDPLNEDDGGEKGHPEDQSERCQRDH